MRVAIGRVFRFDVHSAAVRVALEPGMSWLALEDRLRSCAMQEVKLAGYDPAAAFNAADDLALSFQAHLFARQERALWSTLAGIAALVTCTTVTLNPLFTLCGPVAVFAMILRFDAIRKSRTVFQFAAFRLAAETLRVLSALEDKPALRNLVLTQRLHSAHAVADLAKAATASLASKNKSSPKRTAQNDWSVWRSSQSLYYAKASDRETERSRHARLYFCSAFVIVALTGLVLAAWVIMDPVADSQAFYRQTLAIASGIGSVGLAWITLAREGKCFKQSIDYGPIRELFAAPSVWLRTASWFVKLLPSKPVGRSEWLGTSVSRPSKTAVIF